MNKVTVLLFLSCMLLFAGCEKDDLFRIGFETSVSGNSSGTATMKVPNDSGTLYLKGTVSLTEGQLMLELIDPNGINAYSNSYTAPGEFPVDEFFDPIKGNWTLKYSGNNGSGSIYVHLSN